MEFLYTIGCSTLSQNDFIRNLKVHNINVIADVRSIPYSKITPQFNKEELIKLLRNNRIIYIDFSKEFGARRIETSVYENGKVSFEKTKKLQVFSDGIKRLEKGLSMGYSIALMCTEKNPLSCHRFSLVSRGIYEKTGIECKHILTSSDVIKSSELENEMLRKFNLEADLFLSYEERVKEAYKLLNEEIGYRQTLKTLNENLEGEFSNEKNIYMLGQ